MEDSSDDRLGASTAAAKCAHAGCTCTVQPRERYCSDFCLAQKNSGEDTAMDHECQCGHPECEHSRAPRGTPASARGIPGQ
jgi:hypothetical protein